MAELHRADEGAPGSNRGDRWVVALAVPTGVPGAAGAGGGVLSRQEPYPAPAHGIAAQAEAVRHHDTLERLSQITAPTLVLVGAEDVVMPVYYSRELAERIPGATLQVLERGGHEALWEDPEAGAKVLLEFLTLGVGDVAPAQPVPQAEHGSAPANRLPSPPQR